MQDPRNEYQRLASSDHGNESSLPHLHEGKLAEAFESVSDAFYAVDRQWRFIYANRRAQELWGRSQEELLGKNIWEEFPQAVGSESYQKINQAMEEGVTTEFETVSPVLGTWIAGRVYPSADGLSVYFQDVTERKRTEEALNEANRRTENILESITDEFFALDCEWRFTYINERALRRIQGDRGEGLTREDLLGKNIWEVYPELVGSVFYHKYHDAVREQKTSQFEGRSSLSEGWYEVHAYPSEEGLSVYYRDITERKRAEETLRESEERYRTLFDSIDEGFAIIEMLYDEQDRAVDYRILETNPAFGRMTGFADAADKTSLELNPDAEPYWFEALGRAADTGENVRFESYAEALDRWFDVYASRVGGEGSRRVTIVFADTTERKRAEEELRKSQEALRNSVEFHRFAVEAGGIGTWDLDLQTEECLISPEMAELMDFSSDQTAVPGAQWQESIVPEDRTLMSSALAPSIASDAPFDLEFRIALKDGTQRWLYSRGAVSRDASGKAVRMYGASIDVTERKRAEEERDHMRAREIEARTQKEERRRIARDLHDVVLQDLAGVLQSLRLTYLQSKGSESGLDLEEELEALGRATLGLRSAVHDLRGENERPFVKSVESLVELNRRLTSDREIALVVEEGFPSGLLGEVGGELLRVIREALTNARHHSGAKHVVVTLKVEGSDLVAEISDEGQGFELEVVSGVGLSSMQERAAIVDGRLEIESEMGQGTSVRLQVPVPQTE
jgi:PAS domain S-box-containing protein